MSSVIASSSSFQVRSRNTKVAFPFTFTSMTLSLLSFLTKSIMFSPMVMFLTMGMRFEVDGCE